jgi:N-acyl-D-amino-acid deacylase
VLAHYVRERKVLKLEEAVRRMTSLAAAHMGFKDRGLVAPGYRADLVLFDPATVTDRSTPMNPTALSTGIDRVWVNGVAVFRDGKATGARPGRPVRRS